MFPDALNNYYLGQPVLAHTVAVAGTQGKPQHEVCVEKLLSEL